MKHFVREIPTEGDETRTASSKPKEIDSDIKTQTGRTMKQQERESKRVEVKRGLSASNIGNSILRLLMCVFTADGNAVRPGALK